MATAFVRQAVGTTTITITGAASGNTLVLMAVSQRSPSARTISSIATTNVTWNKLTNAAAGHIDAEIWYGTVAGGTSGTTVTISMSGSGATVASNVSEWSGILTSGTITDGTANTNTGTTTSGGGAQPTTGAFSTTVGNDLVLVCEGHENGTAPTVQPGGSYSNLTFQNNSTTCGVQGNYVLRGSIGAQSASWTIANSIAWSTCIGALRVSPQTSTLTAGMATMAGSFAKVRSKTFTASVIPVRESLGTVAFNGTISTLFSNVTLNAGDTLILLHWFNGSPPAISWNGQSFSADILVSSVTGIYRVTAAASATADIVQDPITTQVVAIASRFRGTLVFDVSSSISSAGVTSLADTGTNTNFAEEIFIGMLKGIMPGDADPTWQNGWTAGARDGIVSIGGVVEGYKRVSATESSQASLTGLSASRSFTLCHCTYQISTGWFGASVQRGRLITSAWTTFSGALSAVKQSGGHAYTQTLTAATATFDAVLTRVTLWYRSASAATMAAALAKRTSHPIGASTMDFAGSMSRQGQKNLTASMSTFSALLARGWIIVAAMQTFAATLTKRTSRALTASMATFSATLGRGRLIVASMATMAATVTKRTSRNVADASMATFSVAFTSFKVAVISFAASMQTFAATIAKQISKFFNAS